jgi:hypothetical protein
MQMHDSELSQVYRGAKHPEPSPALDACILAAAQAAVAPQRRRPAWFGWAVPLSTTAVLVLGISLLFRMQLEAPETMREDMPPLPALELDAGQDVNPAESPAPVARSAAPAAKAMAERKADRTPAAPKLRSAPTVATAVPESTANEAEIASVTSAPAAAEERAAIAPMLPPRPSSVADSAAAPAPASAPAAAAAAGASLTKEYAIRAERETATKFLSPDAAPASAAGLKQGMSRMQAATPSAESPEQWVESIRKLLREGRIEAARKSLEALQKRYPDFPLPPDLELSRCCPPPAESPE